jgi:predicted RNase H-like HicB family nuclease
MLIADGVRRGAQARGGFDEAMTRVRKMLYPIYVHKYADNAYGAVFPDFPDCYIGARGLQALPSAAQEAVELHFFGIAAPIPAPSMPQAWSSDARFSGGFWMMVEVDLAKVSSKAVRLNISLPRNLLGRIDSAAREHHLSRSAFLAMAAKRVMAMP